MQSCFEVTALSFVLKALVSPRHLVSILSIVIISGGTHRNLPNALQCLGQLSQPIHDDVVNRWIIVVHLLSYCLK